MATELNAANVDQNPDYLQYHYNNLGSTTMVTDITGAVKARFQYGTYGELLSANNLCLKFLYNGKYGVATDENGLYYMRARYYNVSIKRFINRDVVTGSISNSQSLNRYSYVQGNPINLLDPFGLSPSSDDGSGGDGNDESFWGKWGHTILDALGFIPIVGDFADVANAVWYYAEGDAFMGTTSLISALPAIGSFVGNGTKAVFKASKAASKVNKAVDVAKSGTKLVSHTTDLTMKAVDIGYGVSDLHQEIKSGTVDWKTAGGLALNVGLSVVAGYGAVKSGNGLRKALNNSGSGTVTAHTSSSIKNTGSPEVSDNKARVQAQVGGENGLSRRAVAEKKLAEAARGTRAEGVLIGKDGDVPVHQSQQQLVNSIESVGARYIGNTRNGDGQIYHMDTPDGSVEIRIMQQKPGQTNPYLDNRTVIVEQGSVGQGTGIYTYGNGARITGAVPKNMRKAIGHTHGQIP